jgi:hypothetical protein
MVEAGNGGGGKHDSHQDQPLAGLGETALFDGLLDEPKRGRVFDQGSDLRAVQT